MPHFVKRRPVPTEGSIPQVLDMFRNEVRFYREIAPEIGIRVPGCYRSQDNDEGTLLVLEDLSEWTMGADPLAHAATLARLHTRWTDVASGKWPWLRGVGAACDLVADLYDATWPKLAERGDLPTAVNQLGSRLFGSVAMAENNVAGAGPLTLVHGDTSFRNVRTSADGEVALLDWEDVSALPGAMDLGWLLMSSTAPQQWADVIAVYGGGDGLRAVFPVLAVQGLLELAATEEGSSEAAGWIQRLSKAEQMVND